MRNKTTLSRLLLLLCLLLLTPVIFKAQPPELVTQTGHSKEITHVIYSPDGRMLATRSSDNTIKLWDVATNTQLRSLDGSNVSSLAFSPDSKLLASGSYAGTIKLWDVV